MRDVIFSLIKYGLITKKDILYFFCESIDDFYKAISFKKITYEKTLLFKNAKILCTFEEFKENINFLKKNKNLIILYYNYEQENQIKNFFASSNFYINKNDKNTFFNNYYDYLINDLFFLQIKPNNFDNLCRIDLHTTNSTSSYHYLNRQIDLTADIKLVIKFVAILRKNKFYNFFFNTLKKCKNFFKKKKKAEEIIFEHKLRFFKERYTYDLYILIKFIMYLKKKSLYSYFYKVIKNFYIKLSKI